MHTLIHVYAWMRIHIMHAQCAFDKKGNFRMNKLTTWWLLLCSIQHLPEEIYRKVPLLNLRDFSQM